MFLGLVLSVALDAGTELPVARAVRLGMDVAVHRRIQRQVSEVFAQIAPDVRTVMHTSQSALGGLLRASSARRMLQSLSPLLTLFLLLSQSLGLTGNAHVAHRFANDLTNGLEERFPEIRRAVGQMVHLFRPPLQLVFKVQKFPEVMRIDVLHATQSNLNFHYRNENLITNDFNFGTACFVARALKVESLLFFQIVASVFSPMTTYNDGFLLLSESFFAQKHDSSFEYEAHRMKLQPFLDFPQKVGDIKPFHTSIIEQISRTQINGLKLYI